MKMSRKKLKLARIKFAERVAEALAAGDTEEATKWQEAVEAATESINHKVPNRNKGPRLEHMKKMRDSLANKRAHGQTEDSK